MNRHSGEARLSSRGSSAEFGSVLVQAHVLRAGGGLDIGVSGDLRLIVVRQGRLDVISATGSFTLRAGEALLSLARVFCDSANTTETEVVTIAGPGELAQDVHSIFSETPRLVPRDSALLAPTVAFALQAMQPQVGEKSKLGDYYIERLLQEMMQGLLADTSRIERAPRVLQDPYRQAMSVLTGQFADPDLTSDDIAEAVNLSRRQLEREFKKRNTTIRSELRRLRVERAKDMLLDSDFELLTIDQVARHVGFSGASSLARAMAQEGHESPSRLRALGAHRRLNSQLNSSLDRSAAIPNAPRAIPLATKPGRDPRYSGRKG
ncbi:MAG: helix-turn-helix domain-containing protein [Leucobacter sp.]